MTPFILVVKPEAKQQQQQQPKIKIKTIEILLFIDRRSFRLTADNSNKQTIETVLGHFTVGTVSLSILLYAHTSTALARLHRQIDFNTDSAQ